MQTNLMSILGFESDSDVESNDNEISFKTTSAIKKNPKGLLTSTPRNRSTTKVDIE